MGAIAPAALAAQEAPPALPPAGSRKKLAAIAADYRIHSEADHLVTRFLEGYWIDDDYRRPPCDIASLYLNREPAGDIGRRLSTAWQFRLAASIAGALTAGPGKLAVDGVLLLGGDGGSPDLRFDFFEQVVAAFRQGGRSVPVFCAGHLAEDWDRAGSMYRQSREMGFPLMAGSSAAVAFRRPELEYPLPSGFDDAPLGDRAPARYPLGVEFQDALVLAPGGSPADLFSSLEVLQAFLERRRGGETGIRSLESLAGSAVWRAAEEGRWSKELMKAALGRAERPGKGTPEEVDHPAVWLIEYLDDTRAAILSLGGLVSEHLAAFRLKGRREIDSTLCYTPVESRNDFSLVVEGISQMMVTGSCPYPIERTLLTTGALSFLRESSVHGKRIETPQLGIAYTAPEHSFYAHGRGW